ncbi:MAG: zf-HC2 domain-containing protein [bacterium]|nr:MAG: zf-HC2 domain-containing protein [bacterium]
MRCSDGWVRQHLVEFAAGTLDEDQSGRVRIHLETCGECSGDYGIIRNLASIEVPDPGEDFWNALPGRVITEVKSAPRRFGKSLTPTFGPMWRPAGWAWRGGLAAAGLAALLILVLWPRGTTVEVPLPYPEAPFDLVGRVVDLGVEVEFLSDHSNDVALIDLSIDLNGGVSYEDLALFPDGSTLDELGFRHLDDDSLIRLEEVLDEMASEGIERG